MKIADIIKKIEDFAPLEISLEVIKSGGYDNSGLLVGKTDSEFSGGVVCIDVTPDVVEKAIEKKANLIISHHPFIYAPLKDLRLGSFRADAINLLLKNDIAVYSSHLCMDLCKGGIDDVVAKMCGIEIEKSCEKYSQGSYGKLGKVEERTFFEYVEFLKTKFNVVLSSNSNLGKLIQSSASFCGSGMDYDKIEFCKANNVDVAISCDIPHHLSLELVQSNIEVVSLDHGESEFLAFKQIIGDILEECENISYFEEDYRLN